MSRITPKTGNPVLILTTAVQALAHGISSLFPSLLALPALPTIKVALQTIRWTGKAALIPITPVLLGALTKTKHSTCLHATFALGTTLDVLPMIQLISRTAKTPTMTAWVPAIGFTRRPCPLLHVCLALPPTHLALPTTQLTGRTASTPITPALMAAHGLLTIRSLL